MVIFACRGSIFFSWASGDKTKVYLSTMESSPFNEAVLYVLNHLQLSSIRLQEQQRAITEHVKTEKYCHSS